LRFRGRRNRLFLVIHDGPPASAVEVVVLAGLERPQERAEPEQAQPQGQRNEVNQNFHPARSRGLARSAFAVTRMEEPDIAIAAMSGVASPTIAIGTAIEL